MTETPPPSCRPMDEGLDKRHRQCRCRELLKEVGDATKPLDDDVRRLLHRAWLAGRRSALCRFLGLPDMFFDATNPEFVPRERLDLLANEYLAEVDARLEGLELRGAKLDIIWPGLEPNTP
jgi:hypothetical protein